MLLVRASLSDELGVPCRGIGKRSGRRRAKKMRGDQSDGGRETGEDEKRKRRIPECECHWRI